MKLCVGIVRMNLHRQVPVGVDELDEDRDLVRGGLVREGMAPQKSGVFADQRPKRLPRVGAGGDPALPVRVGGALPGLGKGRQIQVI